MADPLGPNKALEITIGGAVSPFKIGLLSNGGWIDFEGIPTEIITNYCERAQTRLIEQFGTKPILIKYICNRTCIVKRKNFIL